MLAQQGAKERGSVCSEQEPSRGGAQRKKQKAHHGECRKRRDGGVRAAEEALSGKDAVKRKRKAKDSGIPQRVGTELRKRQSTRIGNAPNRRGTDRVKSGGDGLHGSKSRQRFTKRKYAQ